MSSLEAPKPKKQRIQEDEDDGDDDADYEQEKEQDEDDEQDEKEVPAQRNDEGEAYFELSPKRRITLRKFKGRTLIDFREFYEKNDKMLPGKKGISLTMEQYEALSSLVKSGSIKKELDALE